jgi:hypothetical protein
MYDTQLYMSHKVYMTTSDEEQDWKRSRDAIDEHIWERESASDGREKRKQQQQKQHNNKPILISRRNIIIIILLIMF